MIWFLEYANIADIVEKCTQYDPKNRPTAKDLYEMWENL